MTGSNGPIVRVSLLDLRQSPSHDRRSQTRTTGREPSGPEVDAARHLLEFDPADFFSSGFKIGQRFSTMTR